VHGSIARIDRMRLHDMGALFRDTYHCPRF
jgi:hypothetical protein